MKIGLAHIGPLWFAACRILLGAAVLFVFLGLTSRLTLPVRSEMPVLFSVGLVQVGACMALLHASVLFIDPGKAAVLAYTTPIWAAPMAAIFLGEKMTLRKAAGIGLGIAGVVALFDLTALSTGWDDNASGNAMPLISALLWAGVIVHIRGHGWVRPHLSLLPWQLLAGGLLLSVVAFIGEGAPSFVLNRELVAILAYNGIAATAFSFWAYNGAARVLPASTTALASLSIPVVGVISSTLMLGDPITNAIILGLILIAAGITLSSLSASSTIRRR